MREITGFTRPNLDILWIDAYEYKDTVPSIRRLAKSCETGFSVTGNRAKVSFREEDLSGLARRTCLLLSPASRRGQT